MAKDRVKGIPLTPARRKVLKLRKELSAITDDIKAYDAKLAELEVAETEWRNEK